MEPPRNTWSGEDLHSMWVHLYPGIKPRDIELGSMLADSLRDVLQDIDRETRPRSRYSMRDEQWDVKNLYAWFDVWRCLINRYEGALPWVMPLRDQGIYFLEVFFNTPFDELPLLVNHPDRRVREVVKWRFTVG